MYSGHGPAEQNACERNPQLRQTARPQEQYEHKHAGNQNLEHQLLLRGQTRVFLFLDLGVVIDQTDRTVGHGKAEHRQRRDRNLTHHDIADNDCRRDTDNEHKAAHCRDILFVHVPFRSDFENLLTEFHFSQIIDDRRTDSQRNHQCDRRKQAQPVSCFNFLP